MPLSLQVSKRSLPMLGTAIGAREQCVFAVERDRPNRPIRLEGIVFELFGLVDRGFPRNCTVKIALNQTGLASGLQLGTQGLGGLACVKFDANANPYRCGACFDCRSEDVGFVIAK